MAIIKANNISYSYSNGDISVPVLKDVSLEIQEGEIVAIQGPSGSGKSTLMHILGCLSRAQFGKVCVEGIDVSELSKEQLAYVRNRKLGFIFQQFHLLSRATVLDNILLPTIYPFEEAHESEKNKKRAIEYASKLGIDHRLDHFPNELSGGEQQRVAIARALIRNAKILLADEPTGNLDSKRAEQIMDVLKDFNREQNLTIILVTHEADIAKKADRVIHLHDGEIEAIEINKEVACEKNIEKETKKVVKEGRNFLGVFKTILKLIPLATKNIFRNKARSILTMIGIVIGISAILVMVTLGQFTERKILDSYETLGANTLSIRGHKNWSLKATDTFPLMFSSFSIKDDIEILKKIFPQVAFVSPQLFSMIKQVSFAGKSVSISDPPMLGVSEEFFHMSDEKLLMGRGFNGYNVLNASSVCVIGYDIYQRLFAGQDPIGKVIYISGQKNSFGCEVIGVLKKNKSNKKSGDGSLIIYVPYTFIKNISDYPWETLIRTFYLKVKDAKDVVNVGRAIENYFKSKYGVSGIFNVSNYALLIAQMKRFLGLFNLMLAAISLITLLVGGIGITNMMLVSISERFKEIGIRKAVGATDISMKIQFLLESTIICCLAGVIGLIGGFMAYEGIIYLASKFVKDLGFEVVFSPVAIILSVVSMLVVGIISGLVPALKAEKLDIVTALRSE